MDELTQSNFEDMTKGLTRISAYAASTLLSATIKFTPCSERVTDLQEKCLAKLADSVGRSNFDIADLKLPDGYAPSVALWNRLLELAEASFQSRCR
jgi:hypothetical protein